MIIRILAVGTKMPAWVTDGFHDYAKRLTGHCTLQLTEIPAEKRLKTTVISRLIEKEGEKIISLIKPHHYVIALEVKGQSWSTEQLAEQLKRLQEQGQPIDILIGGPDGLSEGCRQRANLKWSLSPLTLPHPLVRIVLAEQIYRGFSILQGHPYHRS